MNKVKSRRRFIKQLRVVTAAADLAHLPIAVLVSGMERLEVLQQNLAIVRKTTPMTPEEMRGLRGRCATQAADGRFELYKISKRFYGPPGREQHGFPLPEKVPA